MSESEPADKKPRLTKQLRSHLESDADQANPSVINVKDDHNSDPSMETFSIVEQTGDIFNAPSNTLIIHACNCEGSWGAGIAAAFGELFPEAYDIYSNHCDKHGHALFGKALLIPPVKRTSSKEEDRDGNQSFAKHFVGCLFTSRAFGRKKDSPSRILKATVPAMLDLLRQVKEWNAKAQDDEKVGEVRMCKINSGLFAVPWEKTKAALEQIDVSDEDVKVVKIVSPAA